VRRAAMTVAAAAAVIAGCGGPHDYSAGVKHQANAVAEKAVRGVGDTPQFVSTAVSHDKGYRN
jgi:hypothetical protein